MVRLIATDIDNTLLDTQDGLPGANREALARAVAAGIEVVLVTVRTQPSASLIEALCAAQRSVKAARWCSRQTARCCGRSPSP